jgi:uncharacterized protein with ATP-grasp and redox domains
MENIIQKDLEMFMEDEYRDLACLGSFKVKDYKALVEVMNNTKRDFFIFDNAGGKAFEIMFDRFYEEENRIIKAKDCIDSFKGFVFCYQIDGKQTIVKSINKHHF